ncbi:MAG: ABC transporter permease [Spirochaetes bacterium]|nr:ABC transporter permease [Spirochaetota bacterium]
MSDKKQLINKIKLWFYIGFKYIKFRKKSGSLIFFALFFGIALGLLVLISVIGVMNGFQYNHISRRIEIGSYHLTIKKKDASFFSLNEAVNFKKKLYEKFPQFLSVVPYSDREVILKIKGSYFTNEQIIKLRAIDPDEVMKDVKFIEFFKLLKGSFNLNKSDYNILLGEPFYEYYWLNLNETVYLTPDITLANIKSTGIPFKISNIFKTNSYDYDRYWGFISIYSLIPLTGRADIEKIGIKLKHNADQKSAVKNLKKYLNGKYIIQTAEEINKGYFTALKIEKLMMFVLFILIFLMVAANTFGALKLTIIEKKMDISILKAVGASPFDIQVIFILESLILGFSGSFFGVFSGMLMCYNLEKIFEILETVINSIILYIVSLLKNISFLNDIDFIPVKIYDTSIYYQSGFLIRLNFHEIIIICFIVVFMTVFAAYMPVLKASKIRPNEIIKK